MNTTVLWIVFGLAVWSLVCALIICFFAAAKRADAWEEGWQAHLIAATPRDLSPEERILRAVFDVGDNPYRQGGTDAS